MILVPIPKSKKPSHIFKSISVRLIIKSHSYLIVSSGLFSLPLNICLRTSLSHANLSDQLNNIC